LNSREREIKIEHVEMGDNNTEVVILATGGV